MKKAFKAGQKDIVYLKAKETHFVFLFQKAEPNVDRIKRCHSLPDCPNLVWYEATKAEKIALPSVFPWNSANAEARAADDGAREIVQKVLIEHDIVQPFFTRVLRGKMCVFCGTSEDWIATIRTEIADEETDKSLIAMFPVCQGAKCRKEYLKRNRKMVEDIHAVVFCDNVKRLDLSEQLGCFRCGRQSNLQRCSRCKTVVYCSKKCQGMDWYHHKVSCSSKN